MSIGSGDRFKLVCYLGGVANFNAFWAAYPAEEKGDPSEQRSRRAALHRAFKEWSEGRGFNEHSEDRILLTVTKGWPKDASFPTAKALLHASASVPEYLDRCKLRYETVESLLSKDAREEWAASHHNLHFMKALDKQSGHLRAQALMTILKGTYRLYRRHSMLPGLLRESFIIDKIKDGHCEGWYYQYNRTHSVNFIPFNAFFCDFYVIAFGAHQAEGRRTEIVTVSVLVENAFSEEKLICNKQNRFFLGLLTGIYDFGNVLLAERVLIERLDSKILIDRPSSEGANPAQLLNDYAPRHITRDDRIYHGEYMKAIDVIDNSIDGQTLAVRPERLELVLDFSLTH